MSVVQYLRPYGEQEIIAKTHAIQLVLADVPVIVGLAVLVFTLRVALVKALRSTAPTVAPPDEIARLNEVVQSVCPSLLYTVASGISVEERVS